MENKLTVLTNIFNEEYLLPFWLEHHRKIFDHGIVVDYRSTDRSMEIVRQMCPTWEIRTTSNSHFAAVDIDREFMEIEKTIPGYKVVLNVTEFLISTSNLRSMLLDEPNKYYRLQCLSAHSRVDTTNPTTLSQLFAGVESVETEKRLSRFLHSHSHGHYSVGRHGATLPETSPISAYVVWFGFYPWNDAMLKRKLQIKQNIPEKDIKSGFGFHHFWTLEDQQRQRVSYEESSIQVDSFPNWRASIKHSVG